MPKFIDLTGQKFGRLTPIERTARKPRAWWRCKCDCGNETEASSESLRVGDKQSCGCLALENAVALGKARRKHANGWQAPPEYTVWKSMISRCYSPSHSSYKYYGGRGITVAPEWLGKAGYRQFVADMWPKPTPEHQIDRIKNELGYSKSNTRWVLKDVQQRNTSQTNLLTHADGRTMCAKDWAAVAGISYTTFCGRLKRGWHLEEIIARPIDGRFRWRDKKKPTPPTV